MRWSRMLRVHPIPRVRGIESITLTFIVISALAVWLGGCSRRRCENSSGRDPLCQRVETYEGSAPNFALITGSVLQRYGIPSGLELNKGFEYRAISVRVVHGTVANVLDAIIAQAPDYKWLDTDGVVNVIPKRDAKSILNLRLAHFRAQNADVAELSQMIASLPEVREWLVENRVTERSVHGLLGPVAPPVEVSLDLRNLTLRELLNSIVKQPGVSGWSFSRYGDHGQYLQISID
jgi:hypothetical protein